MPFLPPSQQRQSTEGITTRKYAAKSSVQPAQLFWSQGQPAAAFNDLYTIYAHRYRLRKKDKEKKQKQTTQPA